MPGGYAPTVIRQTPQPLTGGFQPPTLIGQTRQPNSGSGVGGAAPAITRASGIAQPIPPGYYNPERNIELGASQRGSNNTLGDLTTKEVRGNSDYTLSEEGIGHREGEQAQDRNTSLEALQRSFQRLGVRQAEQANAAGVLRGGALLQAAAKRGANEGIGKKGIETTYERQQQQDKLDREGLLKAHAREGEDIGTARGRTEKEQLNYEKDVGTAEGVEAARNGYRVAASAPTFDKVNPLTHEHYREAKEGGHTVHVYHSGKHVRVS